MRSETSPEEQPHWGQHPGRESLEGFTALPDGEGHHDDVDHQREEERQGEHKEGKSCKRQVLPRFA